MKPQRSLSLYSQTRRPSQAKPMTTQLRQASLMDNNSGKELIGQYGYARRQSSIRHSMTGQDQSVLQQLQQEQIQQQQQMLLQSRRSSAVSEASAVSVRRRSVTSSNPATFIMSDIYEYEDVVNISNRNFLF